jgi:hypothetical protein
LTTNIEGRLAALKSSTPVNGFQRLLFLRLISEANASGMVSIQITGFHISESRQLFYSIERIVLRFCDLVTVPYLFHGLCSFDFLDWFVGMIAHTFLRWV